jgi:hypothetical protein
MDSPFYLNLVQQTLQQTTRVMPKTFTLNVDYDLIKFEDGYEKPSREVFYSKYNELLRNIHLETLRKQRNEKLGQSDFSMLPDHRVSQENEEEWKVYRQSLRDIPSTTENPENPIWPERPGVSIDKTIQNKVEEDLQAEKAKVAKLELLIEGITTRMTEHERQTGFRM